MAVRLGRAAITGAILVSAAGGMARAGDLPEGLPALDAARRCDWALPAALPPDARAIVAALPPRLVGTQSRRVDLRRRMAELKIAGVSIAVIRGGRLAWAEGFGIADMATCAPVRPDTAFQAASISKSFAATLAMQAVDRGELALDRDINRYLKRWQLPVGAEAPAHAHATLRQLLNHTAAVSAPASGGYPPGTALPTIADAVGDRLTVLVDGGVRSGLDVVRMLALGARGVLLGRAWLFALATGGEAGVTKLLDLIAREMTVAMTLTGVNRIDAIDRDILAKA